jgi:hypothetical protein
MEEERENTKFFTIVDRKELIYISCSILTVVFNEKIKEMELLFGNAFIGHAPFNHLVLGSCPDFIKNKTYNGLVNLFPSFCR